MTQVQRLEWGWVRMGLVLTMALAGCAQQQLPEETPATTEQEEARAEAGMGPHALTDAQIADVLRAVNEGEVATGQLAMQQATDPDARAFAERMVNEHTAILQRLEGVLQAQAITPEETRLSRVLRVGAQLTVDFLRAKQGADFDLAYMDTQVLAHAKVATLGDLILAPQVQNAALGQELGTERLEVQDHLEEGVSIQSDLVFPAPAPAPAP